MKLFIQNGLLINPATRMQERKDIYIEDGRVVRIEDSIDLPTLDKDVKVIDASGFWVMPGLIDVHVHLREPGFEHKETIETGTSSAAKGGFTTICAMPNTNPVMDNEIIVGYVRMKAEKEAKVHVLPIGAITKGQKGEELANIGKMKEAGICAISEDGRSVLNAGLLKKAMIYANMFDLPILSHCEEDTLAAGGCMNAGDAATLLGLKGIPSEAEEIIVARDILLAEKTGASLHICHVSTEGSVDLIRRGKEKGVRLSAEVAPHHFTLTEEAVMGYDTNAKMNPPLRTQRDVDALKTGLKDGTIDMIATDHAPHHRDEKNCEFDKAAFGIVGLETAVALTITELVEKGILSPMEMAERMSYNPAKLLGIDKGNIDIGKIADITIIDPKKEYEIDIHSFLSKSKNSPFHTKRVMGETAYTIVEGNIVYQQN